MDPIVATKLGQLKGRISQDRNGKKFCSFLGIPYAKPPVGALRFKAPQPVEPWKETRDATEEGSQSFQKHFTKKTLIGGEDCLFLNVHTRSIENPHESLKPVMVFIHGGSFTGGTGNQESHGPRFLMTQDIVLVTINYRVGFLGFLSLEDSSLGVPGNAGFKDQVLALKWVQNHIQSFGGNPENVTIFGESAGGASVHYLLLSPMAKGLFHKAIAQSGCALSPWSVARRCSDELAARLGVANENESEILERLMKASAEEVFRLQEQIQDTYSASNRRPFGLVMEAPNSDAFLTTTPLDVISSGSYQKVPFMVGYASKEGLLAAVMSDPDKNPNFYKVNFDNMVPHMLNLERGSEEFQSVARKMKEFYFGNDEPSEQTLERNLLLKTDVLFLYGIYSTVKLHARTSTVPLYFYRFSLDAKLNRYKPSIKIKSPGACHADELGYLFDCDSTPEEIPSNSIEDKSVKRMVALWTNFAKTGNPNSPINNELFNVQWRPVVESDFLHFLDIGYELTTGVNPDQERMDFWDQIFKQYSSLSCYYV